MLFGRRAVLRTGEVGLLGGLAPIAVLMVLTRCLLAA